MMHVVADRICGLVRYSVIRKVLLSVMHVVSDMICGLVALTCLSLHSAGEKLVLLDKSDCSWWKVLSVPCLWPLLYNACCMHLDSVVLVKGVVIFLLIIAR